GTRSHPRFDSARAGPFMGPRGPGMACLEIPGFKEKPVRRRNTLRRRSTAMQIVVVAPEARSADARSDARFTREVCGVGLLERTLVTAQRAEASEVFLVWPQSLPLELAERTLQSHLLEKKDNVRLLQVGHFDPNDRSSWTNLQAQLEDQFIC